MPYGFSISFMFQESRRFSIDKSACVPHLSESTLTTYSLGHHVQWKFTSDIFVCAYSHLVAPEAYIPHHVSIYCD